MSDCCCNPGVGAQENLPEPEYETYNPSEVRLYGRPAVSRPAVSEENARKIKEGLTRGGIKDEDAEKAYDVVLNVIEDLFVSHHRRQIILSAVDSQGRLITLPVDLNIPSKNYEAEGEHYIKSIGVIYGYAYEGHCYKLPKPQIMYLPSEPRAILGSDCGCDCGYVPELGYAVWQFDKLERVVALDVRSDDLNTLVLDENMPGNRSPMAYAQTMALAPQRHRD
ncbi:hypothetical protein SJ05684_c21380 [Sinorhizobium sojae CCBAU 05684]|uniref:Uncharacterized protein n=1 Tax=Sinorhizobium sojae CCBAU 05684 TaxID=716928 RepID=A0A249PE94_9HYPH|nr:hypothetical protein [Sinorhizobium sojae]ASY63579.1 hypothetical protein SJ05684_c21380 [Sinorhizobium sojae CCBAU 05684]